MPRPYVITISSEKGGVGKTTLATNLAIYLKALCEDLPVTLLSFDNHFTVDRMFLFSANQTEFHVGHLFRDVPLKDLIQQGEYGVHIVPSCSNLAEFNPSPPKDQQLADILCQLSQLDGIIIIDTCPILEPYTRNALYAADRVIVPIKDAPSLENCQHLKNFFHDHGITRAPLRLLPCLIDTRIRYSGPFRDSYQLLKAYAINRGYRCLEGYIAKSPKVESLATNPEGKVYPILTHGRGTDVHLQFTHLARQVYLEFLENGPHRMGEISEAQKIRAKNQVRRAKERHQRLIDQCLCCGKSLDYDLMDGAFYTETSGRELCGFIEQSCFFDMVFSELYGEQRAENRTSVKELFRETAQRSYFLLQRQNGEKVRFSRLDEKGETLSSHLSDIRLSRSFLKRGTTLLNNLLERAIPVDEHNRMLLIKQSPESVEQVLSESNYAKFQAAFSRARLDYMEAET